MNINDQLIEAAKSGSIEEIERCLSQAECDPLAKNNKGRTALMLAASRGYESCVRVLLPVSDLLTRDGVGWPALMWAAWNGREACVKLLIPRSDPLAKDNDGRTAVMWTAMSGHEACVRLLLPHSDVLTESTYGESASQVARHRGYPALAEMIDSYVLAKREHALLSENVAQKPKGKNTTLRM